jgi:hypothetical protein
MRARRTPSRTYSRVVLPTRFPSLSLGGAFRARTATPHPARWDSGVVDATACEMGPGECSGENDPHRHGPGRACAVVGHRVLSVGVQPKDAASRHEVLSGCRRALVLLGLVTALGSIGACTNGGGVVPDGNTCVFSGGLWHCPGGGLAAQQCPVGGLPPYCIDGGCFFCQEGAGLGCGCVSDRDGGRAWQCVGTGYACQPSSL